MLRRLCPLEHVRFAALSLALAALGVAACGGDDGATSEGATATSKGSTASDGGTTTGASTSTGANSTSDATATETATETTGASPCAALDCAGCATCMKEGECAELYAECSADPECVGFADCVIPDCIILGANGEACIESCFAEGSVLKADPYLRCVEAVCDAVCFE
ncbi:MAG: hypothetical protein R3A79_04925 [Nannocystaceae bacterium]